MFRDIHTSKWFIREPEPHRTADKNIMSVRTVIQWRGWLYLFHFLRTMPWKQKPSRELGPVFSSDNLEGEMEEIIYFHKDMGAPVPSCCLSGQNGFDDFLFHLCSWSNDFNKPSSLPEVLYLDTLLRSRYCSRC